MEVNHMAMGKLDDKTQALLMFLVFMLPPLMAWAALGMPTDKTSLGILLAALLSGVLAGIKELLGWKPSTPPEP